LLKLVSVASDGRSYLFGITWSQILKNYASEVISHRFANTKSQNLAISAFRKVNVFPFCALSFPESQKVAITVGL
jgi:hypothetical protein